MQAPSDITACHEHLVLCHNSCKVILGQYIISKLLVPINQHAWLVTSVKKHNLVRQAFRRDCGMGMADSHMLYIMYVVGNHTRLLILHLTIMKVCLLSITHITDTQHTWMNTHTHTHTHTHTCVRAHTHAHTQQQLMVHFTL